MYTDWKTTGQYPFVNLQYLVKTVSTLGINKHVFNKYHFFLFFSWCVKKISDNIIRLENQNWINSLFNSVKIVLKFKSNPVSHNLVY